MTTPCLWFSRREPQAKLLGTLSLVRFFGVSKEMNVKKVVMNYFKPTKSKKHQKIIKTDKNFFKGRASARPNDNHTRPRQSVALQD